jgi:anti-sigma regulatory factor (Ser/Thr protein kinase)
MPRWEAAAQETATPTYDRRTQASPAEIGHIRSEVAAFARDAGASPDVVDDIRLAVTEACTNAFVHAYEAGQHAPLHVTAVATADALEIAVRDWGTGLRVDAGTGGLGLGLPLLHELAKRVEVTEMPDAGIEVRMRFAL